MSSFKLDNSIKFYYGLGAAPYGIKDNGFSYSQYCMHIHDLVYFPFTNVCHIIAFEKQNKFDFHSTLLSVNLKVSPVFTISAIFIGGSLNTFAEVKFSGLL